MTRDELLISEHLHNAALEFSTARDHAMKAIAQLENVQELGSPRRTSMTRSPRWPRTTSWPVSARQPSPRGAWRDGRTAPDLA
jgi:4'-phosphopantetheinyl transferase EntD